MKYSHEKQETPTSINIHETPLNRLSLDSSLPFELENSAGTIRYSPFDKCLLCFPDSSYFINRHYRTLDEESLRNPPTAPFAINLENHLFDESGNPRSIADVRKEADKRGEIVVEGHHPYDLMEQGTFYQGEFLKEMLGKAKTSFSSRNDEHTFFNKGFSPLPKEFILEDNNISMRPITEMPSYTLKGLSDREEEALKNTEGMALEMPTHTFLLNPLKGYHGSQGAPLRDDFRRGLHIPDMNYLVIKKDI